MDELGKISKCYEEFVRVSLISLLYIFIFGGHFAITVRWVEILTSQISHTSAPEIDKSNFVVHFKYKELFF